MINSTDGTKLTHKYIIIIIYCCRLTFIVIKNHKLINIKYKHNISSIAYGCAWELIIIIMIINYIKNWNLHLNYKTIII